MDRTTAACAGLAITSMFADSDGWDDIVVQLVRTGQFWHVEVRRQGDVSANDRGDDWVDVDLPADRLVLPAGEDVGIAGEVAEIADEISYDAGAYMTSQERNDTMADYAARLRALAARLAPSATAAGGGEGEQGERSKPGA